MSFCKSDLRTGDVIEFRNGRRFIVLLNVGDRGANIGKEVGRGRDNGAWSDFYFGEDMLDQRDAEWDIMRVWRMSTYAFSLDIDDEELSHWHLVFERCQELTVAEAEKCLAEHFGVEVRIDVRSLHRDEEAL